MRDIRNAMYGAGLTVESSKGECNLGQHEIAFKYDQVLRTADNHVVFKAAAKELADRHGKALTFMAKYDEREGNSCHLHMSLRGTDGSIVFADGRRRRAGARPGEPQPGVRQLRRGCPGHAAGLHAALHRRSTPTSATSRGRSRPRPWRGARTTGPARCGWSGTAAACAWRTGCPAATSFLAGGDAAEVLGLHGVRNELELGPAFVGNAYSADFARVPATLREARDRFAASEVAESRSARTSWRTPRAAEVELEAFEAAVTDWERRRFERF